MAKVGIVMGSDSDMPIMAKAAEVLEQLGIDYEMTIISAHREPDVFFEYAKTEIENLAVKDEPFNFTMLTVDTHFTDGYKCELCEKKYDTQYVIFYII